MRKTFRPGRSMLRGTPKWWRTQVLAKSHSRAGRPRRVGIPRAERDGGRRTEDGKDRLRPPSSVLRPPSSQDRRHLTALLVPQEADPQWGTGRLVAEDALDVVDAAHGLAVEGDDQV